jgi:hypothetical protein
MAYSQAFHRPQGQMHLRLLAGQSGEKLRINPRKKGTASASVSVK